MCRLTRNCFTQRKKQKAKGPWKESTKKKMLLIQCISPTMFHLIFTAAPCTTGHGGSNLMFPNQSKGPCTAQISTCSPQRLHGVTPSPVWTLPSDGAGHSLGLEMQSCLLSAGEETLWITLLFKYIFPPSAAQSRDKQTRAGNLLVSIGSVALSCLHLQPRAEVSSGTPPW